VVVYRTSYSLSAFGEHLIGEEIEAAVSEAAASLGVHITDYSVGALFPADNGEKGRHLYVVELSETAADGQDELFAKLVDQDLAVRNLDYREHRHKDLQMAMPEVRFVPAGTFAGWMESRGKLGAQNKVPRVINDEALFRSLREFPPPSS
jgi:hypothetical protein